MSRTFFQPDHRAGPSSIDGPRPAKQVNVRDLRARLASYLQEVADGASIEVVSRGTVVAELRPPRPSRGARPDTYGSLKGQFWFAPDWHEPSDELADLFEGSVI